jgi:hypothetical protein
MQVLQRIRTVAQTGNRIIRSRRFADGEIKKHSLNNVLAPGEKSSVVFLE